MQRSAFCRSRRELSNAYFLAKFRFDAAENEPSKVCPIEPSRSPREVRERLLPAAVAAAGRYRGAAPGRGGFVQGTHTLETFFAAANSYSVRAEREQRLSRNLI